MIKAEQNRVIIENRKVIADFMDVDYEDVFMVDKEGCTIPLIYGIDYESDWNELMSVVGKIESLGYNVDIKRCYSKGEVWHMCEIDYEDSNIPRLIFSNDETKLTAVYTAVLSFITWHNENDKLK